MNEDENSPEITEKVYCKQCKYYRSWSLWDCKCPDVPVQKDKGTVFRPPKILKYGSCISQNLDNNCEFFEQKKSFWSKLKFWRQY